MAAGSVRKLSKAAEQFYDSFLLQGYSVEGQAAWLACWLSNDDFARSGQIYKFKFGEAEGAETLDEAHRKALASAYIAALPHLQGDADPIVAIEFLVLLQPLNVALQTIETELLNYASNDRLRPYIHEALNRYSRRSGISPEQISRVKRLMKDNFR